MKILDAFKNLFDSIDELPIKSTLAKMLIVLVILALAVGIVFLVWWCEQWLWNAALASYFGWQPISFWQMAGISMLAGWLLKPTNINSNKNE